MKELGRNDRCKCGSGLKFKKCHLPVFEAENLNLVLEPFNESLINIRKRISRNKEADTIINRLRDQTNYVNDINNRISKNSRKRAELIERQMGDYKEFGYVDTKRHDNYHKISITLEADLNNLYSSIKTTSNVLPQLFVSSLGDKFTRRVVSKSFRTFLNSLEEVNFKSRKGEIIRKKLIKNGGYLEENNNEYRNKFVEHQRKFNLSRKLTSSGRGVSIEHYNPDKPFLPDKDELSSGKGDIVHLHVSLDPNLKEGDKFKKGDVIGIVEEDDEHFGKYGGHFHVFSTPGVPPSLVQQFKVYEVSPDPFMVSLQLIEFSHLIVSSVDELLSEG